MADKTVCRKCGKELGPTVRFCGMCGTPVTKETPKAASTRAPAVTMQSVKAPASGPVERPASPSVPIQTPPASKGDGSTTQPMPEATAVAKPAKERSSVPPEKAPEPRKASAAPPPTIATAATERMPETAPTPTEDAPPADARTSAPGNDSAKRTEFQRLLDEVENGFESIVTPEPPPPVDGSTPAARPKPSDPTGEIPMDSTMARALFDSMVVEHARPVRDFMIEVRLGEPPRTWVEFAMPALRAVHRSAQGMGMGDFVEKLGAYLKALEIAQGGTDRLIRGQLRQAIIDTYSDLIVFMPDAFALEQESNKRESIIVHTLLQQVAGLNKVGTDRIYAAGLTSLALFYVARPNDIAELTGIPLELAQSVVNRFREYRKQTESLSPEQDRAAELQLLGELADRLEQSTAEYDKQTPGVVGDARRRELRRIRGDLMLELGLLLARLGEVERLREVEKLPFSARAAIVRAYVQERKKPKVGGTNA